MKLFDTQSMVVAKLPKAGLGNKLLVWAEAVVFARRTQLPIVVIGLNTIGLSNIFRAQLPNRWYRGKFKSTNRLLKAWYYLRNFRYKKIMNESPDVPLKKTMYEFNRIPHWSDYFGKFKNDRETVLKEFYSMLTDKSRSLIDAASPPLVACHIRMGDFAKLSPEVDFKKVGNTRTPFAYFVSMIKKLREILGYDIPVTIFSDAQQQDLSEVMCVGNMEYYTSVNDVVDMVVMSKAKIIITSAGSTFGYWSGFLSNAVIILHPDHIHETIRSQNDHFFEGSLSEGNVELVNSILSTRIADDRMLSFN